MTRRSPQEHGLSDAAGTAPLSGIRVVELEAMGPVPFAGMMLAGLGADVIRIDRAVRRKGDPKYPLLARGKRSVGLDLRNPADLELAGDLFTRADVVLDGFRPGVLERLGLDPEVSLRRNPRLVFGRMTGWGQDGPLAPAPGHDINYLALAGALHPIGPGDAPPAPPLNLVADFGGGGMLLVVGVLAALQARAVTGRGQVVDAAMVDGAALLTTMVREMRAAGTWSLERETNLVDGGAPFYRCYATSDGKYVAVGAIEHRFYLDLLNGLGLDAESPAEQWDQSRWPAVRDRFAAVFAGLTRQEWDIRFRDTAACVTPVLDLDEAPEHPHNQARAVFGADDGYPLPAAAPRFSAGRVGFPTDVATRGEHTDEVLEQWLGSSRAATSQALPQPDHTHSKE